MKTSTNPYSSSVVGALLVISIVIFLLLFGWDVKQVNAAACGTVFMYPFSCQGGCDLMYPYYNCPGQNYGYLCFQDTFHRYLNPDSNKYISSSLVTRCTTWTYSCPSSCQQINYRGRIRNKSIIAQLVVSCNTHLLYKKNR